MRHTLRLLNLVLIVVFIFSFTGCVKPVVAEITTIVETTPVITVPETTAPPTTVTDKEFVSFLKIIQKYDLIKKEGEYLQKETEFLQKWNNPEIGSVQAIAFGINYENLSKQVGEDFFGADLTIKKAMLSSNVDTKPEYQNIIDIITKWASKKESEYTSYTRYLFGDGSNYNDKYLADKDEAQTLLDKYKELIKQ